MSAAERDALRDALERGVGKRFTTGNRITRLRNGVEIIPAMIEAVRDARERVDLLTFVYWTGRFAEELAEALTERSRAGVRVRVLLDGVGCASMDSSLLERMREAGVDVRKFREVKLRNLLRIEHRTHRKVLVCDGAVGFTGGVGIAREWEGDARNPDEWRETHFRLTGPCVADLEASFLENWSEARGWCGVSDRPDSPESPGETPVLVVRSTGGAGWSDILTATHVLIERAQESLVIATGYFVPGDGTMNALLEALERGVTVEIMLPGSHTDERLCNLAGADEMSKLAQAGAKVWLYERTMLHHKLFLIDGAVTMTGSPNFNQRSFEQDDEVAIVALDASLTQQLVQDFEADRELSEAFDPTRWKERSLVTRCKAWFARQIRGQL